VTMHKCNSRKSQHGRSKFVVEKLSQHCPSFKQVAERGTWDCPELVHSAPEPPPPSPPPDLPPPAASAAPPAPVDGDAPRPFQHYKFQVIATRTPGSGVQISELLFVDLAGNLLSLAGATASNPGGHHEPSEGPETAIDGTQYSKWFDLNCGPLIISFPSAVQVGGFSFRTANDCIERDPVSFNMSVSSDLSSWLCFSRTFGYPTTLARYECVPTTRHFYHGHHPQLTTASIDPNHAVIVCAIRNVKTASTFPRPELT